MAKTVDTNVPYLAILLEHRPGGHSQVHAGLARHGIGHPFCDDLASMFEFAHPARDPQFARHQKSGWRHRYAEAYLELNHGCPVCLDILYRISREAGWSKPRSLAA
jgi:hypothetical protein